LGLFFDRAKRSREICGLSGPFLEFFSSSCCAQENFEDRKRSSVAEGI
jgi:hypothetical protein